ncbi:protein phosphatase 1 regulatory subunit 15A isoform X3 [Theropithecus gelada]|uniref:protein phosphatase 1 regulatory subunit 15A isoform X3 n=1 Tax=Theropithecus gelada TaxID=9565 RepID=UPI000DC185EE|nr:protein phosphatase 1 regulatory subunit 15A isoform X3 [Theropithecus gelada]
MTHSHARMPSPKWPLNFIFFLPLFQPRHMAPGQAPHQATPWRDAHPFFLLSPVMGLLSRAWSRLRGLGPPEPWLVEAVKGVALVEAGLEGEARTPLATPHTPWGRHPDEEAEDCAGPGENRETLGLKTSSSLPEAWGLLDDYDDIYSEQEATSVPRGQGSQFADGQPAPLSPSLLIRTLQGSDKNPGEEKAEEEGGAEEEGVNKFSYPLSHRECCPAVEGEVDEETVKKETRRTSTSAVSPGSKPSTWVSCPGEEENQATEDERRIEKSKGARKTSVSPPSSGSNPRAWEYRSGEASEEKEEKAHKEAGKGEAAPGPHSSAPAQRPQLKSWWCQLSDEEEGEVKILGAAEKDGEAECPPCIPPSSAFLKAWVYWPGEDTEEEEDEDSDSGSDEEEGEAEASSSTPATGVLNAFLKSWVYRPGEDTEEEEDEDSDTGSAEDEREAEISTSTPPASAFLKAWVYRPGEDTEEEEDEDADSEGKEDDSEAAMGEAESDPHPSQSAHFRGWVYRPGKETEEEEAAEDWGEAEPCPFRVAIYVPGEKPPPPWAPPRLPLRLQRRLKRPETPTRDLDPEIPLKARKVHFSEKVTVHFLAVWAGPAQAARQGPWEQLARDRSRFARRIARAQEELSPYLTPAARARAWARLRNPPLAPIPALTQTLPSSSVPLSPVQATPLSQAVATPSPSSPGAAAAPLDLFGRRG